MNCLLGYFKCFSWPLCQAVLSVWRRRVWPRWPLTSWSACLRSCCPFLCSTSPSLSSTASSSTSQPLHLMGTRWWTAWPCCWRNRWAGRMPWFDWLVHFPFVPRFLFCLFTIRNNAFMTKYVIITWKRSWKHYSDVQIKMNSTKQQS